MRSIICVGFVVLCFSCASTGNVVSKNFVVNKSFKINTSTKISIDSGQDPYDFGNEITNELMNRGFDVATSDLFQNRNTSQTETKITNGDGSTTIQTESASGNSTYVPSNILITIGYQYGVEHQGIISIDYIGNVRIRILDLDTRKVLVNYYHKGRSSISGTKKEFMNSLEKFIEN